jgi:hypothetical protein
MLEQEEGRIGSCEFCMLRKFENHPTCHQYFARDFPEEEAKEMIEEIKRRGSEYIPEGIRKYVPI